MVLERCRSKANIFCLWLLTIRRQRKWWSDQPMWRLWVCQCHSHLKRDYIMTHVVFKRGGKGFGNDRSNRQVFCFNHDTTGKPFKNNWYFKKPSPITDMDSRLIIFQCWCWNKLDSLFLAKQTVSFHSQIPWKKIWPVSWKRDCIRQTQDDVGCLCGKEQSKMFFSRTNIVTSHRRRQSVVLFTKRMCGK